MSEFVYFCAICRQYFSDEDPHSLEDGEDCHAECCPICNQQQTN